MSSIRGNLVNFVMRDGVSFLGVPTELATRQQTAQTGTTAENQVWIGQQGLPCRDVVLSISSAGIPDAEVMKMTAAERSPRTQEYALEVELLRAQDQVEHLETALRSSRRIGMAIGILMASDKISENAALELLRAASQQSNRKLREVADDVVMTGVLDHAVDARRLGVGRCGSAREH